ncbi:hypothetical protein C3941_11805 [Kaistia algarum]|nr:hypothetical protein C3941_11805 [Kaistia algarum]
MDMDLAFRLALSLAIGLIVGLERGWREREAEAGSRTAGIRTYMLCGLLGGVFGTLGRSLQSPTLIGTGFAAYVLVFAWFKRAEARADDDFSVTGTVAAMLVFALGALAIIGDAELAAAGAIVTAAILASREPIHRFVAEVTWIELRSTLLLLAMALIVLPLLPDRAYGPGGSLNPREIWMFSILVAGLSYAGYAAMRLAGPSKGILVTGLTGGLVSSTAITVAFARRAANGEDKGILAAGAAIAGAVSLSRVLIVSSAIQPALLPYLAPPALAAVAAFLLPAGLWIFRRGPKGESGMQLGNPFELTPVLGFAALLGAIGLASGWLSEHFGASGLYPLAAISGLVDVDAISLSTARQAGGGIELATAATAILIALGVNATARAVYALILERGGFALRLGAVSLAAILVGGTVVLAI